MVAVVVTATDVAAGTDMAVADTAMAEVAVGATDTEVVVDAPTAVDAVVTVTERRSDYVDTCKCDVVEVMLIKLYYHIICWKLPN